MNRQIDAEIKQAISLAKYYHKIFEISGIQFKIGLIDAILDPYYLAIVLGNVHFSDGTSVPAIIMSKSDIRKLLEKYGKADALTIIQFAIGHEIWHLQDFKLNNCPSEVVVDEGKEIEADVYSIIQNDLSVTEYKKSMDAVLLGMVSASNRMYKGIIKIINKYMIEATVNRRIAGTLQTIEERKRIKADPVYKEVGELLLSSIEIVNISGRFKRK